MKHKLNRDIILISIKSKFSLSFSLVLSSLAETASCQCFLTSSNSLRQRLGEIFVLFFMQKLSFSFVDLLVCFGSLSCRKATSFLTSSPLTLSGMTNILQSVCKYVQVCKYLTVGSCWGDPAWTSWT